MQSKLIKAWGPYAVGTVVADNKEEAESTPGAVRVSPARFAKLQEGGHLALVEPSRPIPSEIRAFSAAGGTSERASFAERSSGKEDVRDIQADTNPDGKEP